MGVKIIGEDVVDEPQRRTEARMATLKAIVELCVSGYGVVTPWENGVFLGENRACLPTISYEQTN